MSEGTVISISAEDWERWKQNEVIADAVRAAEESGVLQRMARLVRSGGYTAEADALEAISEAINAECAVNVGSRCHPAHTGGSRRNRR